MRTARWSPASCSTSGSSRRTQSGRTHSPWAGGEANVVWTDDAAPYKKRKVHILNGAHTATAPAAWLAGHEFVRDFMEDACFDGYMNRMLEREVVPDADGPFRRRICSALSGP